LDCAQSSTDRSGELDDCRAESAPQTLHLAGLFVGDGNGRAADDEKDDGSAIARAEITEGGLVAVCAVSIGSAVITEALGLHFILGAFVAGAVMPDALRKPILDRFTARHHSRIDAFFFMSTGLRTEINLGSPRSLRSFL